MNNILSGQITSPLFEARDFKAKKAYEGIDWKVSKIDAQILIIFVSNLHQEGSRDKF